MVELSEEQVIQLLSKKPYITTLEIAMELNVSRNTAIKLLEVMMAKGKIAYRKAGPAKLWFLKASEDEERKEVRKEVYESIRRAHEKAREKRAYPAHTVKLLERVLREMEKDQ